MTVEEAVEVLNSREHRLVEWVIYPMGDREWVMGYRIGNPDHEMTPFEAIAVAEKYNSLPPDRKWADVEPTYASW